MLWMILGAAIAIGGVYGYSRWRTTRKADPKPLWRRLLALTSDLGVAERLVSKERERTPGLSEVALLRRVIKRLERDKRR